MIISVRNWKKFQHYKNRKPPWIKLHLSVLDNPEWHNLSHFANRLLIEIWLLAAETTDGIIEVESISLLAWRLRYASKTLARIIKALQELHSHEFIELDSKTLAGCKQVAIPETEREGEREGETEKRERKRFVPPTIEQVQEYMTTKSYSGFTAEKFVNHYEANGWVQGQGKGRPVKDWKACVRTWVSNEKAEANKQGLKQHEFEKVKSVYPEGVTINNDP